MWRGGVDWEFGGVAGGAIGGGQSLPACKLLMGLLTRGRGMAACVAVAAGAGSWAGGELGGDGAEVIGKVIYEQVYD